jgi:hypothetical protein
LLSRSALQKAVPDARPGHRDGRAGGQPQCTEDGLLTQDMIERRQALNALLKRSRQIREAACATAPEASWRFRAGLGCVVCGAGCAPGSWVHTNGMAEADARSAAVLRDELDAGCLQCAAKSGKCRAMRIEMSRLGFQSFDCWKRYAGSLGKIFLLPP